MTVANHPGRFDPTLGVDRVADRALALDPLVQRAPRITRRLLGDRQVLTAGGGRGFSQTGMLGSCRSGLLTLLRGKLLGRQALLLLFTALPLGTGLLLTLALEALALLGKFPLLHALTRQGRLLELLLGNGWINLWRGHFRFRQRRRDRHG